MAHIGASLLAGCTATSSRPSTSPTPTQTATATATETATPILTPTGTPTPDTQYAADFINDAIVELEIAVNELHFTTRDIDHVDQVADIETREPTITIEFAREFLDEAEREANAEQREQIDALRSFADQIKSTLTVVETIFEVQDRYELGLSFYRSQRYDTAANEFDWQIGPIEDATKQVTEVQEATNRLAPSLSEERAINIDDFQTVLDNLMTILNGFKILLTAASPFIRGEREMALGLDAIRYADPEDYDFSEGEERFAAAIEFFQESEAIFRSAEGRSDTTFQNEIITSTCEATRLKRASEYYLEAAREAKRGNDEDAIDAMARGDEEDARTC